MQYCEDDCPNLIDTECELGFMIRFRVPKSYDDIQQCNWGYVKSKACRNKLRYKQAIPKGLSASH